METLSNTPTAPEAPSMAALGATPLPGTEWKHALKTALRSAADLAGEGLIAREEVAAFETLLQRYPLLLTRYYLGLIDRSDPACPIRRQSVPRLCEDDGAGDGATSLAGPLTGDPLQDLQNQPAPRVTHRYRRRALLHLTPNCSMNCRYCFRKTLLGEDREAFFEGDVSAALDYFARTPEIEEVIFSGGDPFLANESTLSQALLRLGALPHVKRVRFHSRVPVTLPVRVTKDFARLLNRSGKPTVVVCHFNHPREVTAQAREAVAQLKTAGHTVLNQSVLLAGVNDEARVLSELSEALFEAGVLPYYLHHPDRAQGTGHFDVAKARGLAIHTQVREQLPGYLVPRYVVDDPSLPFKQDVRNT